MQHGPTESGWEALWAWYAGILGPGWAIFFAVLGLAMFVYGAWAFTRGRARQWTQHAEWRHAKALEDRERFEEDVRARDVHVFPAQRQRMDEGVAEFDEQRDHAWGWFYFVDICLCLGIPVAITPFWVQVILDYWMWMAQ